MAKKKNEETSKGVARKAARVLNAPGSSAQAKSIAASALTQAANRKGKKKK